MCCLQETVSEYPRGEPLLQANDVSITETQEHRVVDSKKPEIITMPCNLEVRSGPLMAVEDIR